jgi:hypothetical protein
LRWRYVRLPKGLKNSAIGNHIELKRNFCEVLKGAYN